MLLPRWTPALVMYSVQLALLKHKWDLLNNKEDSQDWTEEEKTEIERVTQLAEEMSAQTRLIFDEVNQVWNAGGMRDTDYQTWKLWCNLAT